MKKLYLFIFSFLFILGFSQPYSILLSNVEWKIVKVQWDNVDYYPPPPLSTFGTLTFNYSENTFRGTFYNSVMGELVFGENNSKSFRVLSHAITLAMYGGENQDAVNAFDGMTTQFYFGNPTTSDFTFEYQEVMSGRNLVITNPAGNKIFYSNLILGTSENTRQNVSVYPNPATDVLFIDNLKPNSSLELTDNSGKVVKLISNNNAAQTEIKIKNLASGIYYLKVNGQSVQKIIKK